ncbi:MAG: GIY-YIG nuclease family protein, partial [Candidatus Aenigmarchaeota archaeon]|nr:GIY-YIG nuclease family protein [Candidatus Aenigmarchaeota archaeon]
MVSYILILKLDENKEIKIGSLGNIKFKKGYYMYVGSAKNSIKRIERHFKVEKKLRWHIDYLSVNSKVLDALLFDIEECDLS